MMMVFHAYRLAALTGAMLYPVERTAVAGATASSCFDRFVYQRFTSLIQRASDQR